MGNDGPPTITDNIVGIVELVEQANLYAEDAESGDSKPLVTDEGRLLTSQATSDGDELMDALNDVGEDEYRVRLFGLNSDGDLLEVQAIELDESAEDGSFGQLTYLARALNSQSIDELVARVTDSDGSQIDPMTADPLASVGDDEVRVDLQSSGIQVPVDQQDALEKSTVEYDYAIDEDTDVTLQLDGYSTVEIKFLRADSATDVTVEESWDDSNWEEVESETDVTEFEETYNDATAKHVRLSIDGTGTSDDTADVIIGAVP